MRHRLIAALTSRAGLGALLLFATAALVFEQVASLRLGTPAAMGPGYFPAILGGLFVLFGLLLLGEAWQKPGERVHIGAVRPAALLLGSIVLFALLYPILGGALAIAVLVVVSALAEWDRTLGELAGMVAFVVALVWVVFVWGLGLQLDMLPGGPGS